MGPIESQIKELIEKSYNPKFLHIENESNKHSANLGQESHFKVILVSEKFQGQQRIHRSRDIHELLSEALKSIHALSLKLYTPEEWTKTDSSLLISPKCSGQSET